jgi:heme/copper-type cytochrome/quinol oxidase subunit 2
VLRQMKASPARWLILAAAALLIVAVPVPGPRVAPQDRVIAIDASQFSFDPGTVVVNRGDRVTLALRSTDVVHGLYLDGYDISVTADPGQPASLTFVADRPGAFRFRCSVPCGDIHPFMIGKLRVGTNWLLVRAVGLTLLAATWTLALRVPVRVQPGRSAT